MESANQKTTHTSALSRASPLLKQCVPIPLRTVEPRHGADLNKAGFFHHSGPTVLVHSYSAAI